MGYCEGRAALRIILADEDNPVIGLSSYILSINHLPKGISRRSLDQRGLISTPTTERGCVPPAPYIAL